MIGVWWSAGSLLNRPKPRLKIPGAHLEMEDAILHTLFTTMFALLGLSTTHLCYPPQDHRPLLSLEAPLDSSLPGTTDMIPQLRMRNHRGLTHLPRRPRICSATRPSMETPCTLTYLSPDRIPL